MSILRKATRTNHTTIDSAVLRDSRLTWGARGVFAFLSSLTEDDDGKALFDVLAGRSDRPEISSAIVELVQTGHLDKTALLIAEQLL